MKTKLKKFAIFKNQMIGETVKAIDFDDLINNRMTKKQKEFWSEIKFKDEEDRTITIRRDFLEEGMSFEECVEDWITHCPESLDETIHTIN